MPEDDPSRRPLWERILSVGENPSEIPQGVNAERVAQYLINIQSRCHSDESRLVTELPVETVQEVLRVGYQILPLLK